jgi:hypothetical protein
MKIDDMINHLNMIRAHMGNVETYIYVEENERYMGGLVTVDAVYYGNYEKKVIVE